eukprot:4625211-Alexandrium_andersonii.AAC.1
MWNILRHGHLPGPDHIPLIVGWPASHRHATVRERHGWGPAMRPQPRQPQAPNARARPSVSSRPATKGG